MDKNDVCIVQVPCTCLLLRNSNSNRNSMLGSAAGENGEKIEDGRNDRRTEGRGGGDGKVRLGGSQEGMLKMPCNAMQPLF